MCFYFTIKQHATSQFFCNLCPNITKCNSKNMLKDIFVASTKKGMPRENISTTTIPKRFFDALYKTHKKNGKTAGPIDISFFNDKTIQANLMLLRSFALSFHKISCTRQNHSSKLDAFALICIIFADGN